MVEYNNLWQGSRDRLGKIKKSQRGQYVKAYSSLYEQFGITDMSDVTKLRATEAAMGAEKWAQFRAQNTKINAAVGKQMQANKKKGGFFGSGIGKIFKTVIPIAASFIPGIGPGVSAAIGAAAGSLGGGGLKGALIGGATGYAAGALKAGSFGSAASKIKSTAFGAPLMSSTAGPSVVGAFGSAGIPGAATSTIMSGLRAASTINTLTGLVGGGAPKVKEVNGGVAVVPAAPTADSPEVQAAAEEARKRKSGRSNTIRTSSRGVLGDDGSGLATKRLLG